MRAKERSGWPGWRGAGVVAGLLLSGLAALAQEPLPPAQKVLVADVLVQGCRLGPRAQVGSRRGTRAGGEYVPEVVRGDIRTRYGTRQFANVQATPRTLEDGRVVVYFQVQEYPSLVQEVTYLNAKHLS